MLQKHMRRFIYRTRYVRTKELTTQIQCVARRKVALAKMQALRQEKAAVIIQKHWRRYTARREFLSKQSFILKLQTGKDISSSIVKCILYILV
jgi:myosin-5